jgi:uncharacterized protein (UPF0179 family)
MELAIITLISYIVAKKGYIFQFTGSSKECLDCRFKKVCVDKLRKGHIYRVTKVYSIKNKCPLNEFVITVEVEEIPIEVSIPKKVAIEGITLHYRKIECNIDECPYNKLCRPPLMPDQAKIKVEKIFENIRCQRNISLIRALVKIM